MLAGRGLSAATVAIDPGVFRGVLPLPGSVLKGVGPFLVNPRTRGRAITLTFDQFKYGWANALEEKEVKELYDSFHVAGSGVSPVQMGNANLNPWTEAKVSSMKNPDPGSPAHHRRREGSHGAVGDRERRLQAAEAQPRRDRDREDAESRSLPHDRPRVARSRRDVARVRQAVRMMDLLGREDRTASEEEATHDGEERSRRDDWRIPAQSAQQHWWSRPRY